MPTRPRIVVPGLFYHITQRGNLSNPVFFSDGDRLLYLLLLAEAGRDHGMDLAGWCLMPNHVHLVAYAQAANSLALALRRAHSHYAQQINRRLGRRTGHLWQARFYSCPLGETHFWRALAYVETNPHRAGMVASPEDYSWSSAPAHVGRVSWPQYLRRVPWASQFDAQTWRERLRYGAGAATISRLREATQRGWAVGEDEFVEQLEQQAGRRMRPALRSV